MRLSGMTPSFSESDIVKTSTKKESKKAGPGRINAPGLGVVSPGERESAGEFLQGGMNEMKYPRKHAAFWIALGIMTALAGARDLASAAVSPSTSGQASPITLTPDLSIGVEDGDENFMFGSISRIDIDGAGNIYVLDYRYRTIRVFDGNGMFLRKVEVPAGQGPREATNLSGIAVTPGGTLFINDMRKVIVYAPDGTYLSTFTVDFMISSIGCPGTEHLVAIGPHAGKILHVFDPEGKRLDSFGEAFPVPKEFEAMKEMPMFQAPLLFNCAKDGRIFVLNPHKYEVSVYMNERLEAVFKGKSPLFRPLERMGRAYISTAAYVARSGDITLVVLSVPVPNRWQADVFRGGRQIGSIDVPGRPFCVDPQNRVYFAVEEDFPKVVRYEVKRNP